MELESKVALDFAGAVTLANQMRLAAGFTGQIRNNLSQANLSTQSVIRGLQQARMPNLPTHGQLAGSQTSRPGATPGERAALGAAGAAGSAFFYRATQLANPMAMQRFNDAVDDATAVIGHRMVPALQKMTDLVRHFGDWLANHPTATTALGYGGAGLAAAASLAGIYGVGKMAVNAGKGAVRDIGGVFGYRQAATQAGTTAVGEYAAGKALGVGGAAGMATAGGRSNRAALAEAQLAAFRQEQHLQAQLRQARGLEAAGTLGAAAQAAETERELVALRRSTAASATRMPPPLPAAQTKGSRFGGAAMVIPYVAAAVGGGELGQDVYENNVSQNNQRRLDRMIGTALKYGLPPYGKQAFDWAGTQLGFLSTPESRAKQKASSYNAAARPAQYEDILGSVMQMRQGILSGAGLDPQQQIEENTRIAAEELKKLNGGGSSSDTANNSSGGGSWIERYWAGVLSGGQPSNRSTGADR